jgi:hypothetical protein
MKATLFFFFILLTTTIHTFSQSQWQEYQSIDGIKFSVQDVSCDQMNHKFIKIENTSNKKARVSYQVEVRFQNSCSGCDGSPEYRSEITLSPGEKVEGGCNYSIPARLDILVANANLPDLRFVSFAIKDISIKMLD